MFIIFYHLTKNYYSENGNNRNVEDTIGKTLQENLILFFLKVRNLRSINKSGE